MSWKCLKQEYVISNKFLKVRKDIVELPNGVIMDDYFVIEKNDVVIMFAITQDFKVIIKEEYRYPKNINLIELPAGTFNPLKETPIEAAKRELKEETGYASDKWQELGILYDYPTKETNSIHVFLVENARKVSGQELDVSEDIKFNLVTIDELKRLVDGNKIIVSNSVATIYKALRLIEKNNRL